MSLSPATMLGLEPGAVNDPLEREADRVAKRVMSASTAGAIRAELRVSAALPERTERDAESHDGNSNDVLPASASYPILEATSHSLLLTSTGRRLPRPTLDFMQSRFAADFTSIRIHDSRQSAALTRGAEARAFTLGRDVFFGEGEYRPESRDGMRLIAHELTHVLQQRRAPHAQDPAVTTDVQPVVRRAPLSKRRPPSVAPAATPRAEALDLLRTTLASGSSSGRSLGNVDPDAVAQAILSRLRDAKQSRTGAVLVAAFKILAIHPWTAKRLAYVIAEGMDDSDHRGLLEDASGPEALNRMILLLPPGTSQKFTRRMREFGKVEAGGAADQSIRANRKTTDPTKDCMNCVSYNIEAIYGANRRAAMQKAAGVFASQARMGVRLRDYAKALVERGEARELVYSKLDQEACESNIRFDPKGSVGGEKDPFTFGRGKGPIYKPDPLATMRQAIRYGEDGLYVFIAAVEGHHAITLIAEKSGRDTTFFWNDPSSVERNKASNTNSLGHLLSPDLLAWRVWTSADNRHSRAEKLFELWRAQRLKSEREKPEEERVDPRQIPDSFQPANPKHIRIVERQRCNGIGIRIWQLLPKTP